MKIAIVVYPECASFAVTGMHAIFSYAQKLDKSFSVMLISATDERMVIINNTISINCSHTIDEVDLVDVVLLPGIESDIRNSLHTLQHLSDWLLKQHKENAHIASSCTASFILANHGLIKGSKATTHWKALPLFAELFPQYNLNDSRVIIDKGNIIISGGTGVFMNLCLYIIEKYISRKLAIECGHFFMIDIDKHPQTSYADVFMPAKHDDDEIIEAELFLKSKPSEIIAINELAQTCNMSERNFGRRFKKATNYTPSEYQQRLKIKTACNSLLHTQESIDEIAANTGYIDTAAFRKLFKKYMGITASAYRKKHQFSIASE